MEREEEIIITRTTKHRHASRDRGDKDHSDRDHGDRDPAEEQESTDESEYEYKRLIVCCDGTWLDSDSGLQDGKIVPPSNVTRLTRAIKPQSSDGIQQIVYYQAGVGSMGTAGNKLIGGISGDGLAEHVREAYSFIANNYSDGDEIFLVGFSRGAYTARAVAGVIDNLGVLTKTGLESFPVIYKDWSHRHDRRYRSPLPDVPFPNKPPARGTEYARELGRRHLTRLGVRIKAIGVFDTVGSLGIPKIGWFGRVGTGINIGDTSEYRFYDTTLGNCIDNAFQALALDERRAAFQPALWEKRPDNHTNLIQVWFPGVHANVGGGYPDQELSDITLAWMLSMLTPLLDFSKSYPGKQQEENAIYYESRHERPAPWSFGKLYNSVTGLFALGGTVVRTPGDYYRIDPRTGERTNRRLRNTNEYVHASVRSRCVLRGPGYGGKGTYDPKALRMWRLVMEPGVEGLATPWFWEDEEGVILPEAPLRKLEISLLESSPEVKANVLDLPKPKESRRRRRREDDGPT